MIDKSLANSFQYTKLKYKQYFQFKYTTMFLLCFFLFTLFISPCFFFVYLNLSFSLNLIHFYLIYYHESIISFIQQKLPGSSEKKTGNKIGVLSFLATKRLCSSLLVDITHYWLFKFLKVKFFVGTQISSQCELQ